MKKIDTMFFLSLPVICTLPISLCSLQANDYKDEKEKIKDYCLFDYIKLTGRQDAQIEGDLIPLKKFSYKTRICNQVYNQWLFYIFQQIQINIHG